MSEIMRAHRWGTNAAMIADVAQLGYIEGRVLDATYGLHGGFWMEFRPLHLQTNDLNAPNAEHREDFRRFPHSWAGTFDTVVFDPPYKLNGTPAMGDMDARFGTGERMTREEKLALILDGAVECFRVTRKWLLVKCMDQVEGARLVDRFDLLGDPRPQPGNRRQLTARSNYSTLLVFRKENARAEAA